VIERERERERNGTMWRCNKIEVMATWGDVVRVGNATSLHGESICRAISAWRNRGCRAKVMRGTYLRVLMVNVPIQAKRAMKRVAVKPCCR